MQLKHLIFTNSLIDFAASAFAAAAAAHFVLDGKLLQKVGEIKSCLCSAVQLMLFPSRT